MKRVVITGASGFIGSYLLKKFKEEGFHVEGWGLSNSQIDGIQIKEVNLFSIDDIAKHLYSSLPDILIHCAGTANVSDSILFPNKDYNNSVTITHNLVFSLHKTEMNTVRFVFLSSAAIYGNPTCLPIKETMNSNPLSPYALHKDMCERICYYAINNYNMDIKIARIFSAYGNGLKKQILWDMNQKVRETGMLRMFGTGKESRDFIHVVDVAQSIFLISTSSTNDIVFNVANGEEITIFQLTNLFAQQMNIQVGMIEFNGICREGDPLNWCADISRIKALGYEKSVDLSLGVRDYCKWLNSVIENENN